jgi:hypothetical protein
VRVAEALLVAFIVVAVAAGLIFGPRDVIEALLAWNAWR